jgi:PAS domain-containing protein
MNLGLLEVDLNGIMANQSFLDMSGYDTAEELIGNKASGLF